MKLDWPALVATLLGAAILGGFSGYIQVQNKTLVNEQRIQNIQEDVEELLEQDKEQQQIIERQYQLLQKIDRKL